MVKIDAKATKPAIVAFPNEIIVQVVWKKTVWVCSRSQKENQFSNVLGSKWQKCCSIAFKYAFGEASTSSWFFLCCYPQGLAVDVRVGLEWRKRSKLTTKPLELLCKNYDLVKPICSFSFPWKLFPAGMKNKNSERSNWNKPDDKDDKDQLALSQHYSVFHDTIHKPPIHEDYTVALLENPQFSLSGHLWR